MGQITRSPILITGCARSGTSLIAAAIHICGAFGGTGIDGPKSMLENPTIKELEQSYLKSLGVDASGQSDLPNVDDVEVPINWEDRIHKILKAQGYSSGAWFYKSSLAAQIWPVWETNFPNAKWIIVRRRNADIAESCLHTAFMNKRTTYDAWLDWIRQHESRFVDMIEQGMNVKQIWPERMLKGNYEQLYEVIEWLGLPWKMKEVLDYMEPRLYKAKQKQGIIS